MSDGIRISHTYTAVESVQAKENTLGKIWHYQLKALYYSGWLFWSGWCVCMLAYAFDLTVRSSK